jgi:hypothetical protein
MGVSEESDERRLEDSCPKSWKKEKRAQGE